MGMSKAEFIIRWDDVSRYQNRKSFRTLADMFVKYDIPAVLGVIPDNQDNSIQFDIQPENEFVDELKSLKNLGWEVALHGYRHMKQNENGGILNLNRISEFAGREFHSQLEDLKAGKEILTDYGFDPMTFIPPWHSYDDNTITALSQTGFRFLSDGLELYPKSVGQLVQMPVLFWSIPRRMKILSYLRSIYTICLHPHLMIDDDFAQWDRFFKAIRPRVITFKSLVSRITGITECGWQRKLNKSIFHSFFKKA